MSFDFNDTDVFFNVSEHAHAATYTPLVGSPFAVKVIWDAGVRVYPPDFDSQVVERRHEMMLPKRDVPHPRRGETITIGLKAWKVDEVVEDDNFRVTVVVK